MVRSRLACRRAFAFLCRVRRKRKKNVFYRQEALTKEKKKKFFYRRCQVLPSTSFFSPFFHSPSLSWHSRLICLHTHPLLYIDAALFVSACSRSPRRLFQTTATTKESFFSGGRSSNTIGQQSSTTTTTAPVILHHRCAARRPASFFYIHLSRIGAHTQTNKQTESFIQLFHLLPADFLQLQQRSFLTLRNPLSASST